MRRISLFASLALCAGLLVAPVGAQELTCNGMAPTEPPGDLLYGGDGPDVLIGTPGADRIYAEGGNDTICALGGDDEVGPGSGDDFVDAGDGSDWLLLDQYVDDGSATVVDLPNGTASGPEGSDQLVLGTVENVELNCSVSSADTLIGDDADNTLSGGSGADTIEGGGGDDLLYGTDPSVGRTDAICWAFEGDEDVLDGGEGDDVLLGQESDDELDGASGWDILDGGDAADFCTRGERYVRCESQQTPAPPAECDDGADNDGDGIVDGDDPECSHPNDPSEEIDDDPGCNDGRDNDGDGAADYPADQGCAALDDDTELDQCIGPCPPTYLTIEYKPGRALFRGKAVARPSECGVDRRVLLKKKRPGDDRTIGRDHTNGRAAWHVGGRRRPRGYFYVVAPRSRVRLTGGEIVRCPRLRSPELRIQSSSASR